MLNSNWRIGSFLISLSITIAGILCSANPCQANIGTIVPSYFSPGTGGPGGVGDGWAAMTAAATKISVTAVLNPDSGPQPGPADPSYVNAMTQLENAGGKTVAYVFTDDGQTPLATVETQINTYLNQYANLINGFYLDGMSVTPGTLAYYQTLNLYIKNLSASYTIIGNPGHPFLNGVLPADYLSTADVFDIFEGPGAPPPSGVPVFNDYPYGQTWYQSYPADRFDNTIYGESDSAMLADVTRAAALNAGFAYITDQSGDNPYAQLPSYWDQEVTAIASLPEPGTVGVLAIAALALHGGRRRFCNRNTCFKAVRR